MLTGRSKNRATYPFAIRNLLMKLNDEDRNTLCCLLIKAGYAARIGKERPGGKGQIMYFVEFWEEDTDA